MNAARLAVLSVLVNVALAFGVWRASRPAVSADVARDSMEHPAHRSPVRAMTNVTRVEVTLTNELLPFRWEQVQSAELTNYVANLRGVGCPEETIRDIIRGELTEQFLARRRVLLEPWQRQYWDLAVHGLGKAKEQVEEQIDKLEEQTVGRLDEILGAPAPSEDAPQRRPDTRWSFLSEEKQQQIATLAEQFDQLRRVLPPEEGKRSPERMARLKELQQQQEAAIQALLSPEELAEHKLRTSRYANVGKGLTGFDATPDEMRTVARVYEQFANASEGTARNDPAYQAKLTARKEAQRQRDEALKAELGEARYAELKRAQDGRFQEIFRVAERYELPRETAVQVDEWRRVAQENLKRVRDNQALSAEQQAAMIRAIQDESRAAILQAFGERAARTYERNGGEWLRQSR